MKKQTAQVLTLLAITLFTLPQLHGQSVNENKAPKSITELKDAIENILKQTGTPAVGIALVMGDTINWHANFGIANVKENIKANEKTMFRIGSISKMYVALAVLKLQEEGKISLKDKIRNLIPEVKIKNPWEKTSPILVENLLEHTTGWKNYPVLIHSINTPNSKLNEIINWHPEVRTSNWIPGTKMSYNDVNITVAAYIVEKISGQPFEDYIHNNFFSPMKMETMTYFKSTEVEKNGVTLYSKGKPLNYWHISSRPCGAINATSKDMLRMIQFFLKRGAVDSLQIIKKKSLLRMETPTTSLGAKAGLEYGYALCNASFAYKNFVYRWHSGGLPGARADLAYIPEHQTGYVVMTNNDGPASWLIGELIRNFQTQNLNAKKIAVTNMPTSNKSKISGFYAPIKIDNHKTYFFERILFVEQFKQNQNILHRNGILFGNSEKHYVKENNQYISPQTGKVNLVRSNDPITGEIIQADWRYYQPVSSSLVYIQLITTGLWIFGILSSIILGIIWLIRYKKGKITGKTNIMFRLWPFISSIAFLLIVILFKIGLSEALIRLGNKSFFSISIQLLTICFAVTSTWSIYYIARKRKVIEHTSIVWYSSILSSLHFIVTIYFIWHGVIGIQTWS